MTARRATPSSSLVVHVAAVDVRVPLSRARVAALACAVLRAERVRAATLSIAFVDAPAIATLNWRHLRHRGPTDVLTFRLESPIGSPISADVYIAPEIAREHARLHGCGMREEIARLVVHAVLHAVGRDHPDDDGRVTSPMWRRQEQLLARLLPRDAHAGMSAP